MLLLFVFAALLLNPEAEPEIDDLDVTALVDHHVLRLEVSVEDPCLVACPNSTHQLRSNDLEWFWLEPVPRAHNRR